jgi:hypothetical protein
MRSALILMFGWLTWASSGTAQHRLHGPASSSLFAYAGGSAGRSALAEPEDSLRRHRPTYWQEGGAVGGALGLLTGALVANGLCGLSEESTKHCTGSTLLGGVLGAAILAIPGALIGGQFSKKEPAPGP